MIQTEYWYDIRELWRDDMLDLIESTPLNQRLKSFSTNQQSIIPIFHYWNCYHFQERKYITAVDRFWRDQIMGILTYTLSPQDQTADLISIGTFKKWKWIGTLLIDHFLYTVRDTINTLNTTIHPDDPDYELRWTHFLQRKAQEYWVQLRINE